MASGGMQFSYRGVDAAGLPQEGVITGASQAAVMAELKTSGLQVMRLDEKKSGMKMELNILPKRVKAAELTVMTRQLSTMVASGMTLLRAFYVLEDQVENPKLKDTLSAVREDIEAGLNFSDALDKHPKVFGPLYVAMVRAGEAGGVLEQSLERTADQLEKDDSLRRQVKGAMMYPAVVMTFAGGVLVALLAFIVPVFVAIFKDFGGKLPMITQFTVNLSSYITGYWYVFLFGGIGFVIGFKKWKKSSWGRPQWDQFRLRIPVNIGKTVQKIALARWSRTFSSLYSAGVPIMQAIEVTGKTAGNTVVERAMDAVVANVKGGGSISAPLKDSAIFPGMVTQMIAVGEETGNLDTMLTKVADFYEDEVAAAIKAMTSILEPVMIVLVGGIVGFIVVAMYMPMFKVYEAIQ